MSPDVVVPDVVVSPDVVVPDVVVPPSPLKESEKSEEESEEEESEEEESEKSEEEEEESQEEESEQEEYEESEEEDEESEEEEESQEDEEASTQACADNEFSKECNSIKIKKELKEAFTKSDKNVLAQAMQRGDKFYLGLGETFKEKGFVENYIKRLSEKEVIKNIDFNGVISHEYGHLFDFKNKIDYFTSHSDKLFDIMIKEQNKFISKGYFERPIKEKIGSYLFTNRQEFFAECYRLYDNNIMPNELKFVNDYMKKIFKK